MPEYLTPGVYAEEIPGQKSIEGVGTSVAGFVGECPLADAPVNKAVPCNSWPQFCTKFVGEVGDDMESSPLVRAVHGFFINGGSRCFIVNIPKDGAIVGGAKERAGLDCLRIDEISTICVPGRTDAAAHESIISFCENEGDKFGVLDATGDSADVDTELLKKVATVKASASGDEGDDGKKSRATGLRPRNSPRGCAAFYFPYYTARDPFNPKKIVVTPPSGAVAGIFARIDATRGVHKAPGNEVVRGALGVTYPVTKAEQGDLNRNGVNCIRVMYKTVCIWGARTLSEPSSDVRYVNVRRLLNFLKESIEEGIGWAVFEPNDRNLWSAVSFSIRSFLLLQWKNGALMGATPEQAFFVDVSEKNNTPESIAAGQLICDVGVCCSKPAEFVVFRISQWSGAEAEAEA